MTAASSYSIGIHDRPLAGILHMVGGVLALSGIDVVSKFLVGEIHVVQMLTLRAAAVMLVLLPYFHRHGGLSLFRTRRAGAHVLRAAAMFMSVLCFFHALSVMPLATVVALGFTAPLFVTALSQPMLGEPVGVHRWAAVVLGFVGTLVVVDLGAIGLEPVAILPVIAAFGWAFAQVQVRRLATTESDGTIMIYLNSLTLLGFALLIGFFWQPAGPRIYGFCFVLGLLLVGAQWLMLRATRLAPVAAITPFQYLELPMAVAFGWAIWGEWPGAQVFVGAALIVASGLYVILHERRRTRAANRGAT